LGAAEFFFPRFGESFVHVSADDEGVGGLPGLRLVFEEFKFDRKIVPVLLDEFVHSAGVGFHDDTGFFVEERGIAFRGRAEAEKPEMLVDGDGTGPKDFRELAAGNAAEQIHLPEAILGHDVALGFGHVG